jgi:hypothetical protein
MGFTVGSLKNVPLGDYEYKVFVITNSETPHYDKWISNNFPKLARDIGPKAAIVKGYGGSFSDDIRGFLDRWINEDANRNGNAVQPILHLLAKTTCLLIARGDLRTTNAPILLIPLAPADQFSEGDKSGHRFIKKLMDSVMKHVKSGTIFEYANTLGVQQFELKSVPNGLMVTTLRHLNEVADLKPNIAGIGLNFNALIERLIKKEIRV